MIRRLVVGAGLVVSLAAPLVACADGKAAQEISNGLDVVDASTPTGGTTDGQVFAQASAQVCRVDRTTMETAIEAYTAVVGTAPTSEADLVTAQMIRSESANYDVTPTGQLVPCGSSTCT